VAIARQLGISEATVGTYWGRVRIKLGPRSRTELVAIFLRHEQEAELEELRRKHEHIVHEIHEAAEVADEGLYRTLLDQAPDAMIVVDSEGRIQYSNAATSELFGYAKEELEGSEVGMLVPERYREQHAGHRAAFLANPGRKQMGEHLLTPAVKKDGTEFQIRASLSSINTHHGPIATCAIRAVPLSEVSSAAADRFFA
jgi:PAS domain S-box-containing protein